MFCSTNADSIASTAPIASIRNHRACLCPSKNPSTAASATKIVIEITISPRSAKRIVGNCSREFVAGSPEEPLRGQLLWVLPKRRGVGDLGELLPRKDSADFHRVLCSQSQRILS
jgi:hypothetical protein